MAETVDWNDERDPRVRQHRIRQVREQHEIEQQAKASGIGLLRGFTDQQLLDELERRHPEAKGDFAGSNFDGSNSLKYTQDGSGSYRYNDPVDWTKTAGAGITDDTSGLNPNLEPTRANSITTTILQPGTLPSQHQANVVVDEARREREQRAAEAGQPLDGSQAQAETSQAQADSQGQQNAAAQVVGPS